MLYYSQAGENISLSSDDLKEGLVEALNALGKRQKVLAIPPDITRFYSRAGELTEMAWEHYGKSMTDILPALGTDSAASNPDMNLWREMQIVREDHGDLDPATVFAMATRGGAEAMGCEKHMGTLAQGKQASFLAVRYEDKSVKHVYEFLTTIGHAVRLCWICDR